MDLSNIQPAPGSTHRRKRIGRGIGSGHGKTAGRGHKGDKARGSMRAGFEGGQTPLQRRLPHRRGFTAFDKKVFAIVNLSNLEKFENGDDITPDVLIAKGIVGDVHDGVKILGNGELTKKLNVRAHRFSKTAQEKIVALGGTVETIEFSNKSKS
jgi:large subunit ribosomal protein L15